MVLALTFAIHLDGECEMKCLEMQEDRPATHLLPLLLRLTYYLPTAFPISTDHVMGLSSRHDSKDNMSWIPDFFQFNFANAGQTTAKIMEDYPGLTIIERPETVTCACCLVSSLLFLSLVAWPFSSPFSPPQK